MIVFTTRHEMSMLREVINKCVQNNSPLLNCLINRAGISAFNTATHMQLIGQYMVYVSHLHPLRDVIKTTLHSANWGILRCILIVYYITIQTSASCNLLLCCDSPNCVPCIFNDMFTPLLCKHSKNFVLDRNEWWYCTVKKSKHPTSLNISHILTK